MKIKNISKNNLSFPLKKKTGQKIVTIIHPDEFVFSEEESKKTENQQLIIYERKKLIQITNVDKPEDMEYYKPYTESKTGTEFRGEVEYFNPSLDVPVTSSPNEDINEANLDEEEEIIPITKEELIGPQIIPITPDVEPELINSSLDNEPTIEFAGGIRENINTTDTPEVVTVTDSTESKPKHAGGRPKGVKNKPTDKSKKKNDHRKNWKFLKK